MGKSIKEMQTILNKRQKRKRRRGLSDQTYPPITLVVPTYQRKSLLSRFKREH